MGDKENLEKAARHAEATGTTESDTARTQVSNKNDEPEASDKKDGSPAEAFDVGRLFQDVFKGLNMQFGEPRMLKAKRVVILSSPSASAGEKIAHVWQCYVYYSIPLSRNSLLFLKTSIAKMSPRM